MQTLPPSPSRIRPWTSWQVMRRPGPFYRSLLERYGDAVTLHTMNGTVVGTMNPEGVKAIFSLKHDQSRPFGTEIVRPLVGEHSVIALSGKAHHRERRVLMPAFHGPRMKAYGDHIQRIARERIASWEPGSEIVVNDEMNEITFRVIVHAIFGVTDPARVDRYLDALKALVGSLHPAYLFFRALQHPWLPGWGRFLEARAAVDALIYEDLEARRADDDPGADVLGLLLKSTYEDGTPMPDAAIRDELVTLLFAGLETTAIALSWCVSRAHRHPEAAAWVRETLDTEDPSDIAGNKRLRAFWQETLRLDTIVPDVLRELTVPLELDGHTVPAGSLVAVLVDALHRRPDVYPDPETFRPERFVASPPTPFTFVAFGGGTRRCVGVALATYEIELTLAELLRADNLEVLSDDVPARRTVTMGPSEGVRARVH